MNSSGRQLSRTIALIQREYLHSGDPWFLGYSGGKDSSALLKLVYLALLGLKIRPKPITVVYCDTGVEIPVVQKLVSTTLHSLSTEAQKAEIPLFVRIATPVVTERYFVKVIGRGYPPPSNKFRWCTDRLRINPVNELLRSSGEHVTVLLGVRRGESIERDRTLKRHGTRRKYYLRQTNNKHVRIFSPLLDYATKEIWAALGFGSTPYSIRANNLAMLYWQAGGDCPIIRDPKGTPCGKGRFGCWTCTVVRKDQAVENLVAAGYHQLAPLLEFRNWLAASRNSPELRCKRRRNGQAGPGPFTLKARRLLLRRLLLAQSRAAFELISKEEIATIRALWRQDLRSTTYAEQ